MQNKTILSLGAAVLFWLPATGAALECELPPPTDAGVVSSAGALWTGGVVPYSVSASLPRPERVRKAIAHWERLTPIRFVARTDETDYLVFEPGDGCASSVGRVGGAQSIRLALGCPTPAVIHEIGHAVGLWHEQSRNDRDGYIEIQWQNIQPGHEFNFSKFGSSGDDVGAYDVDSIMHYDGYAFSKNGSPTIVERRSGRPLSSDRKELSAGDAAAVRQLYRRGT